MPGSKLLNLLEDLQYRVLQTGSPLRLVEVAAQEKPMVVLADMVARNHDVAAAIERLRNAPETRHIPVIAVVPSGEAALEKEARVAGARLVVNDNAILLHLRPLLEQALHEE